MSEDAVKDTRSKLQVFADEQLSDFFKVNYFPANIQHGIRGMVNQIVVTAEKKDKKSEKKNASS